MKKKLVSVLLCAVMVSSMLYGCGSKTEAPAADAAVEETTEAEPAKQWIGFEALLTVEDAKELRAFFNKKNIEFRMILK